jgi:hypothetical protein
MKESKDKIEFDVDEFVGMRVEQLVMKQRELLKKGAIARLNKVISLLQAGKYDELVENYLFYSPSGDGYGKNNYCIEFGGPDDGTDIHDIISRLKID